MRAHAGRSITKLLCKIAINVAPIVRLRLVDSHISTYLIRLLVLLPPCSHALFRASHCAGRERKEEKKKEEKRGEKSDERGKKKKKGVSTFPSILSSNVARSFSLGIMERASNAPIPIFAIGIDIELRNGALVNFRKVYRACLSFFARKFLFLFFFFFIIHVTIIMRLFSPRFRFEFNPRVDGSISFRGRRHN